MSPEILYLEIETIEGEKLTLKELIHQTTPEHVVKSNYVVGIDTEGKPFLSSFNAWTENCVLTLINTAYGSILVCNERNYR